MLGRVAPALTVPMLIASHNKSGIKLYAQQQFLALQADREQLLQLGEYQTSIGLGDDVASEIVKEAARARVEADLDAAVECIRKRTAERDYSAAVDAVRATG